MSTIIPNLTAVYDQLSAFAGLDSFSSRLNSVFGTQYDVTVAQTLRSQWQSRNFSQLPQVEVLSGNILGAAKAAYSTTTNKIYVSDRFLATLTSANDPALKAVLLEEVGHFVDAKINKTDTRGDEGELFSNVVRGITLSTGELARIKSEDDRKTIVVKGQTLVIEQALPTVYETVKVSPNGYNFKVSGSNAIWISQKGSNATLNLYNGTTIVPIANSAYSSFSDFAISGSTVVYAKNDGADTEIYRYSGGITTKLTNNTFSDSAPQIDGTNIVWYGYDSGDSEIFRYNGTTTTQLTNNTSNEQDLKLSGAYAVWAGFDGSDYEIYLNDGTTTKVLTSNTTDDYSPVIAGNKVAWFNWDGTKENLYYYNGTSASLISVVGDVYKPTLTGDKIVYSLYNGSTYSLQLYNATTKTPITLANSLNDNPDFQVDGNWVVWREHSYSGGNNNDSLKLYNGTSTVTVVNGYVDAFAISGSKIAYTAYTSSSIYNQDLFLYDGTTATPTTTQVTSDNPSSYTNSVGIVGNSFIWNGGNGLYIAKPSTKPILTINNVTVIEGQTSPQNAVLTVTLSAASTTAVTVQYATETNYSATNPAYSGSDYTQTTGTLTFAAGQLTKTINVPILNDDNPESDETFTVKLSNAVGAVFVPGQNIGTVTITDTLQQTGVTGTTFTLPVGVENLTLTGTTYINGTGNTNANVIRGNSGNNILDGKGITSYMGFNDQLVGGLGNDTYIVSGSSFQTTITENLNEGTDTVQYSSTNPFDSYNLGNNLENLILTGTDGFSGTGNSLDNVITGNSGNNYLDGGAGTDTVSYTSSTSAVTVNLTPSFPSGPGSATGGGGSDNLLNFENVIGSNFNDIITGNSGANTLTGSYGKDNLTGGAGADKFDYKALTHSLLSSFDVITDFNAATGNDRFLVTTARAGLLSAGAIATLDTAGISAKLTAANFLANYAASFTFTSGIITRTFVAINDATAGFSATTDAIVEVTGLTGTLATTNFVTV